MQKEITVLGNIRKSQDHNTYLRSRPYSRF